MLPLRKTFLTMVAFDQRDDGAAEPRLQPSGSLSPRDMKLRMISLGPALWSQQFPRLLV